MEPSPEEEYETDQGVNYKVPREETREKYIELNRIQKPPITSFREDLDRVYPLCSTIMYDREINLLGQLKGNDSYKFKRHNLTFIGRTSYVFMIKVKKNRLFTGTKCCPWFSTSEHFCTAKVIDLTLMPEDLRKQILENELHILKTVRHPNLIEYLTEFRLNNDKILIILMEHNRWNLQLWASAPDTKIQIEVSKQWCFQVIAAIYYLHRQGITHRDLRASDVLIFNDGRVKVCDFTHAKYCIDTETNEVIQQAKTTNDIQYMAPELFYNDYANPFKTDCFSLGIIVFIALFKRYPFGQSPPPNSSILQKDQFFIRILQKEYRIPEIYDSPHLFKLISTFLEADPDSRITAEDALLCPWFFQDNPEILDEYERLRKMI